MRRDPLDTSNLKYDEGEQTYYRDTASDSVELLIFCIACALALVGYTDINYMNR